MDDNLLPKNPDSLEIIDAFVDNASYGIPPTKELLRRLNHEVRAEIVALRKAEYEPLGWAHFDVDRVRNGEDFGHVTVFRKKHCATCQPVYFKTSVEDMFKGANNE